MGRYPRPMTNEHPSKGTELPTDSDRCGQSTQATWSTGCDGTMQEEARHHLGFPTRLACIEWAAQQAPGSFSTA